MSLFDLGPQKIQEFQQIARNPSQHEKVDALVAVLVELEYRQLERVEELHDALGIEGVDVQGDREQRKQQLLALADHVARGEFESFWFREVVGDHIENPEQAKPYAGLSEDDWQDQIEEWAATYRGRVDGDLDMTDREIAATHVENTFGVSLGEFEREVVEYRRQDALRTVLSGNFEAVEAGIQAATAEVENGGGD